ncbi:MAG: hypothetical protein ACOX1V_01155 [Candidatus Iainarchaeum sp.]
MDKELDFDFEDLFNQFGFGSFSDLNEMFGGGRGGRRKREKITAQTSK